VNIIEVSLIAQQAALLMYPAVMVATPVPIGISPHWMDRKIGMAWDYEKAEAHLHILDPASAKQEEQFARDAKLASAAKGEAMIGIAVKWLARTVACKLAWPGCSERLHY